MTMQAAVATMLTREDQIENVAAGTTIFREGDPGTSMYVILEGEITVSTGNRELATLRAEDLFGEMSLIEKLPRSATATAKTDCKLAAVDQRQFLFLVHETPTFALDVMRVISHRLCTPDRLL